MWGRMFGLFRRPPSDDELKDAARRATERMRAELARQGISVEMATHRKIDDLEQELRRDYQETADVGS